VSAHAVADDKETQLLINAKTILILRSPAANIAFGTDLNPHSFPILQNSRAFLYPPPVSPDPTRRIPLY